MAAAEEPLLVTPPPSQLPDYTVKITPCSSTTTFSFHPISPLPTDIFEEHHEHGDYDEDEDDNSEDGEGEDSFIDTPPPSSWSRKKMKRCRTAPAMAVMTDFRSNITTNPDQLSQSSSFLVRQASVLLLIYLSLGVIIYSFNRDHFSGIDTHPVVDAVYFSIVTMCTIGYGDIAPTSPPAKVFACVFVLVGFGFIDILLSGVVNYVLDLQENIILKAQIHHQSQHASRRFGDYFVDVAKGRMRIRLKVGLALGVVVVCIGIGTLVLYFVEGLDWVDSVYLSVMSVTTVGYGDRAFKTMQGRLFAAVWLLFSTLAVARAFLYLAEARVDKRHRKIANWVLRREITVQDLLAADINHNGFISKSEYIVYKLKEMGKIREKDIMQVCDQFNKLDRNNAGKITLPDLLENHL